MSSFGRSCRDSCREKVQESGSFLRDSCRATVAKVAERALPTERFDESDPPLRASQRVLSKVTGDHLGEFQHSKAFGRHRGGVDASAASAIAFAQRTHGDLCEEQALARSEKGQVAHLVVVVKTG